MNETGITAMIRFAAWTTGRHLSVSINSYNKKGYVILIGAVKIPVYT